MKPPVFILAMGRSGTMFLANLLYECEGANVWHEPSELNKYDIACYKQGRTKGNFFLSHERVMWVNEQLEQGKQFIECNGYLRGHAKQLRKVWPDAKIIQLVRDPRKVIRSLNSRKPASMINVMARHYNLDVFYLACHFWKIENKYLRPEADMIIKLEDMRGDYEELCELLDFIGLEMPQATWEKLRGKRFNKTPEYKMPPYEKWTPQQKEIFRQECLKEGREYGYRMAG